MVRKAVLAAFALCLAGCSSSGPAATSTDESGPTSTTSTTGLFAEVDTRGVPEPDQPEPILQADVQTYLGGFHYGAVDIAYDLLSERCKQSIGAEGFKERAEEARATYREPKIEPGSYAEEIEGTRARVSYEQSYPELDETDQCWVLEGSHWRNDDC